MATTTAHVVAIGARHESRPSPRLGGVAAGRILRPGRYRFFTAARTCYSHSFGIWDGYARRVSFFPGDFSSSEELRATGNNAPTSTQYE